MTHPTRLDDPHLLAECDLTKNRTRGPGGQHRNKVESGVHLTHRPTGIEAGATERRSSVENQRVALRRMRLNLAVEVRAPVSLGDAASDLWRSRVKSPRKQPAAPPDPLLPKLRAPATGDRIAISPDHEDFPAILAEALDFIADANWDHKPAAIRLGVSPSQLLKLIKDHPPAFVHLNRQRATRGLHALK
ncbi:MAG TPA: peptide chain release factor-like protein [Phycisphaerales bacterium]|nr:peptide chain release factor-like protein [Phycisphaerales bacterium]